MNLPNQRRCVSCGTIAAKASFWRIVRVHSSHQLQLDDGMGRSAYVCPTANCLKIAQKKNRLSRALRAPVSPELYHSLWRRLSLADNLEAAMYHSQGTTET